MLNEANALPLSQTAPTNQALTDCNLQVQIPYKPGGVVVDDLSGITDIP